MTTAPSQTWNFRDGLNDAQQLRKPHILWLANYPLLQNHTGHPASWMTSLAETIQHDVILTIVSWNTSISVDTVIDRNGIKYVYLKSPRGGIDLITGCLLKIKQLRDYISINKDKFDLIHIHGSENQFLAACAPFDLPKVLSVQGIMSEYYKVIPETLSYRRFYWLLAAYYERRYGSRLSHFMCRTHWDTSWAKKLNTQAKVHQVWEMIRPDFFLVNDDFSNHKNLLYVGGVQRIKGFKEILQALDLVKSEYPYTKLIILGTKPKDLVSIKRLIRKLHLLNTSITDLDFRGMQDVSGVIEAYRESFCLVHPSYIDNSPNSICEAQIAGIPVVATDVGGVSSLIETNKTGLLTSLNPIEIARQILRLKSESNLSADISKQSRITARQRHDPHIIRRDVLSTYKFICLSQ